MLRDYILSLFLIYMEKKELPKQQRRKRKDPESRDFYCKCGKGYLSYAAVYTHVKNKHDSSK